MLKVVQDTDGSNHDSAAGGSLLDEIGLSEIVEDQDS